MKKTTPASGDSAKQQNAKQRTVSSVVTRLQAKDPEAASRAEPDIDFSELRAAIDELPTMDATKVVALHRRIVNGDYEVDVQRLAEKMMQLESTLDPD